ncbi:hypothetical protein [Candidatus Thiodubiliella endoseptemdiera]|uniref:hypothetical protein n=1 Tax=Candidatus Thiodubiliella endoseptemdiera TaxID=2738886 RepID=UPI0034E00B29
MKTLKKCEKYLITVKCNDPFITSSYIQKTEGEVVDLFNNLYFWFDDAYGQECFIACNADNVISIEDMPTKLPAIIQS